MNVLNCCVILLLRRISSIEVWGVANVSFPCFKVMVGRLEKKKAKRTKNKQHKELDNLLSESFLFSRCSVKSHPPLTQEEKDFAEERKELCSNLVLISI